MYYVYVLRSLKDGKLYIGSTSDLKRRCKEHYFKTNPGKQTLKLMLRKYFNKDKE
ncbi:MAG: GIY-YIG nuclease family protein [Patescibacteria group bacterium]